LDYTHGRSWELLLRHRDVALAVLLRRTGSVAEAEDSVQEALARLGSRADLDAGRVRALLVRTALGIAAEHRRTATREQAAVVRLAGGTAAQIVSPEALAAQRAEASQLLAAIDALPRRERQVLQLQLSGLSVAEMAARLGISYKSVEGALTRARARVRLILGGLLAWVAERLRRLASSRGETAATTVAALLLLVPSPHRPLDARPPRHGVTAAPPQAAAMPDPPGPAAKAGPVRSSRHGVLPTLRDAPPTPDRAPGKPAPYDPTIVDTGTIGIPGLVSWGVRIHGNPDPTKLDPVGGIQRCLANPNTDPFTGPC
jgi:RNA polymerase sigma factor (sigma-70 family)